MLYGPFWSSGWRELEGPCCSAAVCSSWRAMAAYLMAVVSSIPNTAARCRGSAPQVRASSSCRSTRSRSRVAVRPRHDPASQVSLTARVVMAVCWLMIRCGVAVPGQRRARGQVVGRAGLAGDDQPPAAEVDVAEVEFADGLGPGGVHGG